MAGGIYLLAYGAMAISVFVLMRAAFINGKQKGK